MPRSGFTVELRGSDQFENLLLRLSDFQRLIRIPLNAGLGGVKRVMQAEVHSRKATASIKVRVYKDSTGMTGRVGPTGGDGRPGFLAALFLESGTGLEGPKHRPIQSRSGKPLAFWSQSIATERFGPRAQLFTKSGRLRKAAFTRFGNAGQVVVKSTAGMPPRPWFDRAIRNGKPRFDELFGAAFDKEMGRG